MKIHRPLWAEGTFLSSQQFQQQASSADALCFYLKPSKNVQSEDAGIVSKADEITAGIADAYGKVRAIHDWVASYLYFDYDALAQPGQNWPKDALGALECGRTVCEGYANLTTALLRASGIPAKTVTSIGNMATPMGLMAMGATFDIHKASAKAKPSIVAAVMKLVGFAAVFLPIAAGLGFKNEEIVAILVMLGSATTVSSYVMAKNMGHEGVLTASTVMLTTMFSAFTLTGWLYILKTLGIV